MRLSVAILLCCVNSVFGTTYFVDWTTGSDANSGLSKTAAFKRAPGMKGFSGSYSHAAGDRFVFKGGETWPASCYQWKITQHGSSESVLDTYTADVTWYSGASFTRPKFDFEHVAINGWTLGAGVLVQGSFFTKFDNLEFMRHRTPLATGGIGIWGTTTITFEGTLSGNLGIVTNCVVRDWDQPSPMVSGASGGGGINRVGLGNVRVLNSLFHQDNVTQKNGTAMWNMAEIGYCEVRNTPTAIMYSGWATEGLHNNWLHDLPDPEDPAAHSNAILSLGGRRIYSNLIHDTTARAQIIFINSGYYGVETSYIYNNVTYNNAQPSLAIDSDGVNNSGAHTYVWNNSFEGAYSGSGLCVYSGVRNNGPIPHLEMRNNHFISTAPIQISPVVTTYVHSNNLTNTYATAVGFGYTPANLYAPIDGTKPTVGAGYNLSASFTTDYDGTTRVVPWDIGAHEWVGVVPPSPGTLVLSAASQSVSEDGGTITITAQRTGGSAGAVGCSYATVDWTAMAGVNYTATTGALAWADGDTADKTFTVTLIDADMVGNLDFLAVILTPTGGAAIGTPSSQTVTVTGTGTPAPPGPGYLIGWTWPATNGVISPPFTTNLGYIYQPSQTIDITLGGSARYTFTNSAGFFTVEAEVNCVDGANDSFAVAMNSEPVNPDNVWHIRPTPTVGWENRTVGWQGSGTYDNPEFPTQVWYLESGTNTLVIRGRETGGIRTVTLVPVYIPDPVDPDPPPITILSATSADANGYYKASAALTITLTFSTNVTVTGTPTLALNSGGTATYASGSTGTNLTFSYTVGAGQTSEALDYTATNSLSLSGGTIRHGVTDADLTLPVPGAAGSVSHQKTVVIDTTRPTVTIGAPSLSLVTNRLSASYKITFADLHWEKSYLTNTYVTLTRTGSANCTVETSNNFEDNIQTVTLVDPNGNGTIAITLKAGVGRDLAGNTTAAVGPSTAVTVDTWLEPMNYIFSIRSGVFRSLRIGK